MVNSHWKTAAFKGFQAMRNKRFWILAVISFILLTLPNGFYTAFDKDEPKYLEAAREMVNSGDYITPYYNYEYRFDKPILIYWIIAVGYKLFGVNELGGRFFVSIFGVLTVLLLYLWLIRRKDEDFAFWSSMVLLSLLDFMVMSSIAMPDIVLTFFITASLIAFYEGYNEKSKKFYLLAFLFSGFATLTKGPVGLVLPGLIAIIYLILRRDLTKTIKEIPWFSGFLIYSAVVLPWYGAIFYKHGYEFFKEFIIFHNIHRFLGKVPGHPTEWWYYLANYFWLYLPFSFFFFFAVYRAWKDKEIFTDNILMFSFCWFFGVFIFFQTAHTKLAHYLLPSFPAFAVIITWYLRKEKSKIPIILTALLFFVLLAAGTAFFIYKGWNLLGVVPLILPLIGVIYALKKDSYLKPITISFILTMILFKWVTLPTLQPFRAKPVIAKELREIALKCKNCKFYFLSYESPEIVYGFRKGQLKSIGFKEAEKLLKSNTPVYIVTRENRLNKLHAPFKVIDKRKELITKHSLVIISNTDGSRKWEK